MGTCIFYKLILDLLLELGHFVGNLGKHQIAGATANDSQFYWSARALLHHGSKLPNPHFLANNLASPLDLLAFHVINFTTLNSPMT